MNQILNEDHHPVLPASTKSTSKHKKKFLFIFFISISICIISFFIYFSMKYHVWEKEKISQSLVKQFSITTLYTNTVAEATTARLENTTSTNTDPFVIGLIEINKIKLLYPILSSTTEDSLKIAPCHYAGPLPNQVGNLCIAGHNYVDNKLFSKIHLLQIGDTIHIYDLQGNKLIYEVYATTEVDVKDVSCTSQNTNGRKEITLITCNNVTGTRVIVKAKENR